MALTKGQKIRKKQFIAEAQEVVTQQDAERLWDLDEPKFIAWVRATLLGNAAVWEWVKPLYDRDINQHQFLVDNGHEWLITNKALTDKDLVSFGLVAKQPLTVLEHPGCGDLSLQCIAKLWETNGADNMDCVPDWATEDQVKRMYELRPSCKGNNATVGSAKFVSRFA